MFITLTQIAVLRKHSKSLTALERLSKIETNGTRVLHHIFICRLQCMEFSIQIKFSFTVGSNTKFQTKHFIRSKQPLIKSHNCRIVCHVFSFRVQSRLKLVAVVSIATAIKNIAVGLWLVNRTIIAITNQSQTFKNASQTHFRLHRMFSVVITTKNIRENNGI